MSKITDALRDARAAARLMQKDVAKALGISVPYYSDMENGRREFSENRVWLLPGSMRQTVADAIIQEHRMAIERMSGMTEDAA